MAVAIPATLRDIAKGWLNADGKALAHAVADGLMQGVDYGEEDQEAEPVGEGTG